jgi:2-dehydropantoate 2-reductase
MGKRIYQPKRFAVVGAGPVGAIVAAFLSRGGCDVTLCDVKTSFLEPALDPGILIEGADNLLARVARATTCLDDLTVDPPDVVILAVKAGALPLIARTLEGFAGEGRYVVCWQNGIDTERILAKHLGAEFVLRAVVNLGCVQVGPAHVRVAFHHRPHYIQELDPRSIGAAVGISEVLTRCGLETRRTGQIQFMVWRKAVLNACMNPICAVTGKTMAEVMNDPFLFRLVDILIKEGESVARANDFPLGPDFYPYCIDYIRNAGAHKPSMLQDIEAGRRTEVDCINGKIIEYGARSGIPTPYNTMIRNIVKTLETEITESESRGK